jgi:hypothetical protein
MVHNPFYHRGPIREASHFINRRQETAQAANLLRVSQSVSITGPRRIGKTSLLYHLLHEQVRVEYGLMPPQHVLVSMDAEGMGQAPPHEVYALFLEGLRDALRGHGIDLPPAATADAADYRVLDGTLKALSQRGSMVTFFVDEFELLAANHNLDPSFFSGLRGLTTRYAVSYVVASQRALISLVYADNSVLSSPFFNVFVTLPLGLFDEPAARGMLAALSTQRQGTALPAQAQVCAPTAQALDAVVELAGPHPFFLQVAAYYAHELAQSGDAWSEEHRQQLTEAFYREAQPHYLYAWHGLNESERYTLANLLMMQHESGAREALRQLQQQCLILPTATGWRYLSSALQRFVRGQNVADLLQAGPMVIDLGRRAVTVEDQILKLTKTQFDLLAFLARKEGQVATNQELEQNVWHDEYVEDPERLKTAIKHLRRALGPWGECVANERGVGYALRVNQ